MAIIVKAWERVLVDHLPKLLGESVTMGCQGLVPSPEDLFLGR